MEDKGIVLNNSIASLHINLVGPRLSVAMSKPEDAAAADDGELPDGGEHGVPAQDTERAAVELPLREDEVEHHEKADGGEIGGGVNPLRSAHDLGAHVGAQS